MYMIFTIVPFALLGYVFKFTFCFPQIRVYPFKLPPGLAAVLLTKPAGPSFFHNYECTKLNDPDGRYFSAFSDAGGSIYWYFSFEISHSSENRHE